ncbi:MAG: hypothetical protein AVDCRST_MAG91-760 [uncultured Sphingomonadaceae bacterium]|uniref:Uncharacterized protein n=1 Tax=uncultured Sphingomonadaceae bacterium TaxID=169976 RepID=A0A6J4SD51_9SPHN|nr:MAG: hypothetical protein AVDCRST_MAG91-760 [uncultured Sphingomonadaceae bacterium]
MGGLGEEARLLLMQVEELDRLARGHRRDGGRLIVRPGVGVVRVGEPARRQRQLQLVVPERERLDPFAREGGVAALAGVEAGGRVARRARGQADVGGGGERQEEARLRLGRDRGGGAAAQLHRAGAEADEVGLGGLAAGGGGIGQRRLRPGERGVPAGGEGGVLHAPLGEARAGGAGQAGGLVGVARAAEVFEERGVLERDGAGVRTAGHRGGIRSEILHCNMVTCWTTCTRFQDIGKLRGRRAVRHAVRTAKLEKE